MAANRARSTGPDGAGGGGGADARVVVGCATGCAGTGGRGAGMAVGAIELTGPTGGFSCTELPAPDSSISLDIALSTYGALFDVKLRPICTKKSFILLVALRC